MPMKSLKTSKADRAGYIFILIVLIIGIYLGMKDPELFNTRFADEDGIAENLTVVFLLGVVYLCIKRLITLWNSKSVLWRLGTMAFALLFFFAAGEEISWGQRLIGWDSGDFFLEHNAQEETNLHNMMIGETKVNKLIFSQVLTAVLVIYLIIVPILYRRLNWVKNLFDRFAVPVSRWHHTIAFLLVTLGVLLIPASRKWEVYEMSFGVIFFLIFLRPWNLSVFRK